MTHDNHPTAAPLSREEFINAVAKHIGDVTKTDPKEWVETATAVLDGLLDAESIQYGCADFDWTLHGASELANEEMSCWEE